MEMDREQKRERQLAKLYKDLKMTTFIENVSFNCHNKGPICEECIYDDVEKGCLCSRVRLAATQMKVVINKEINKIQSEKNAEISDVDLSIFRDNTMGVQQ